MGKEGTNIPAERESDEGEEIGVVRQFGAETAGNYSRPAMGTASFVCAQREYKGKQTRFAPAGRMLQRVEEVHSSGKLFFEISKEEKKVTVFLV